MGRRITSGMVVLLVFGAWISVAAQTLADASRAAAERRKEQKTQGRVLTNADLPASAIVSSAPTAPTAESAEDAPAAAPESDSAEGAAAAPAAANASPRDDQDGWRAKAAKVSETLSATQGQVRQLQALTDRLAVEMLAYDPAIQARASAEREQVKAQLGKALADADAAFAARRTLEDEARRAGVPPAWIQ